MAAGPLSKTQLDKLGDRLRSGSRDEADIRSLNEYRQSFRPAFESVMDSLNWLRLEKTGRMKTVGSIVDKLNRQRIRLTQIQDIAGVRLTCADAADQDLLTLALSLTIFPGSAIDDRRHKPSHWYRAVHLVVTSPDGFMVEVQGGLKRSIDGRRSRRSSLTYLSHRAVEIRQRTSDAPTASERETLVKEAADLDARVREQRVTLERELESIAALIEQSARQRRGQR